MRSLRGLVSVRLVPVIGLAALAVIPVLAAACGSTAAAVAPGAADGGGTTTPPVGPDGKPLDAALPCDVEKILAAHCQSCHSAPPKFGAPMPLVTLADLNAASASDPARKVHQLAVQRVADDAKPMPEPPNPRLSEADRATLAKWSAAGAPAGTEKCNTAPPPRADSGVACKPDLPLGPATAYDMPTDSGDEYVCYGVELSRPTPTHVVGFAPRIDNTSIVHHIVLFEADQPYSTTPTKCGAGGSLQWRMVTGWAPGGTGFELPPQAGFPLRTTGATHYVVQMHYSNPQALANQKDQSGFDLCTSAPRQYEADVLAFGTQKIDINPGETKSLDCAVTVPAQLAGTQGIHLIAAMPHMHQIGTGMSTTLLPAGGGPATDLGTINNWSFSTQAWLPIAGAGDGSGAHVKTGDVINTRCTWKNTTGQSVKFGENTADEMCYSFTTYYPRINSNLWSWALPALTSQCK